MRFTLGNIEVDHADIIRLVYEFNSTPVRPAVVRTEFIQPDDEESPRCVVECREASFGLPLVMTVDLYLIIFGPFIIQMAEVFRIVFPANWIMTPELKHLTLHAGNCSGFDADQSCNSGLMSESLKKFFKNLIILQDSF